MKHFRIYKHPDGRGAVVKVGWSWPAFLFRYFWAFFKRLWAVGVGALFLSLVFVIFVIGFVEGGREAELEEEEIVEIVEIVGLGVSILFGWRGNRWREGWLFSRGFELVGELEARNADEAATLHLKARQAGVSAEGA